VRGFSVCQELLRRANGYTKCGPYLLAASLVAALLDGFFEQPAGCVGTVPNFLSYVSSSRKVFQHPAREMHCIHSDSIRIKRDSVLG
jgi:hypothetical protein